MIGSNDADEALRHLKRALELNPENRDALTRTVNLLGQRRWPYRLATLRHSFPVRLLKTAGGGSRLFVANGLFASQNGIETIHIWDLKTLKLVGMTPLTWGSGIFKMEVTADGTRLLFPDGYKRPRDAKLAETAGGKILTSSDLNLPDCLFSTDDKYAIIWGEGGQVEVRSAERGDLLVSITVGGFIDSGSKTTRANDQQQDAPATDLLAADVREGKLMVVTSDGTLTVVPIDNPGQIERRKLDLPTLYGEQGTQFKWAIFDPHHDFIYGLVNKSACRWPLAGGKGIKLRDPDLLASVDAGNSDRYDDAGVTGSFDSNDKLTLTRESAAESAVERLGPDPEKSDRLKLEKSCVLPLSPAGVLPTGDVIAADGSKAYAFDEVGGGPSGPLRHNTTISSLAILGRQTVATGSEDGDVRLWHIPQAAFKIEPLPAEHSSTSSDAPTTSSLIDRNAEGTIELGREDVAGLFIRQVATGRKIEIDTAAQGQDAVINAHLARTGTIGIFSGYSSTSSGGTNYGGSIFRTSDGEILSPLLFHPFCAAAIFTADGSQVMTLGDGQIRVWDTKSFTPSDITLTQPGVAGAWALPGGRLVVSWNKAGDGIVWDAKTWTQLHQLTMDPLWRAKSQDGESAGRPVCATGDERRLAMASGNSFVIWDLAGGRPICDPVICSHSIEKLRFIEGAEPALEVTLADGSTCKWNHVDLGAKWSEGDVQLIADLAGAVADGTWPSFARGKGQVKSDGTAPDQLLRHFRAETAALPPMPLSAPDRSSSEAVVEMGIRAAQTLHDETEVGQIVAGLRSARRIDPQHAAARVDQVVKQWETRGWTDLELSLAGDAWRWPETARPGLHLPDREVPRSGLEFEALRAWQPDNAAAIAGYYYWSVLKFKSATESSETADVFMIGPTSDKESADGDKAPATKFARTSAGLVARVDELSKAEAAAAGGTPDASWRRARVLAALGRLDEARAMIRKATNSGQPRAEYFETAAALELAKKNRDAALMLLNQALTLENPPPSISIRKAALLLSMGHRDKALDLMLLVPITALKTVDLLFTGDSLWQANQRDKAQTYWQQCGSGPRAEARMAAAFSILGQKDAAQKYAADAGDFNDDSMPEDLAAAWAKLQR